MKKIQKALAFVSIFSMVLAAGCGSAKVGTTKAISTGSMNTKAVAASDEKKVAAGREKADAAIDTELQQKNKELIDLDYVCNPANVEERTNKIISQTIDTVSKESMQKSIQACKQKNISQKTTDVQFKGVNSAPCPDDIATKYKKNGYVVYQYTYVVSWAAQDSAGTKNGVDDVQINWLVQNDEKQLFNIITKTR